RALALSLGSSTLIVIKSKSRVDIRSEMETRPGNSATQGAHHVAQTLIIRTLPVGFLTRLATPAVSMVSRVTGLLLQVCLSWWTSLCVIHLVEQPAGRVTSTGTGLPSVNAANALRASGDFTVDGSA